MSSRLLVVAGLVLNALLWSQSRYSHPESHQWSHAGHALQDLGVGPLLARRSLDQFDNSTDYSSSMLDGPHKVTCKPLAFPIHDQCAHVWSECPRSETFLSIPYLQNYFCSTHPIRGLYFSGLILWLVFLFSFIGITASDFFCPNLSTIAQIFGLSDNVAGVTFLAFGNGSPDLFSTYSAMRANTGSLAVGELLGAASFIVSVVVGSMCIVKPFHVRKVSFLRDVGFFSVSVALLLFSLYDGKLTVLEAALMIVLYVIYVITVIVGTWWGGRRQAIREREERARAEYADDDGSGYLTPRSFADDDTPRLETASSSRLSLPSPDARVRAYSNPTRPQLSPQLRRLSQSFMLPRPDSRASSPGGLSHSYPAPRKQDNPTLPSFSLIGALEFQSVVNALQKQSNADGLSVFESPATPFAAGHYHHHRTHSQGSRGGRSGSKANLKDQDVDPWDATLEGVDRRSTVNDADGLLEGGHDQRVPLETLRSTSSTQIPSINVVSPQSPKRPHNILIPGSESPKDRLPLRAPPLLTATTAPARLENGDRVTSLPVSSVEDLKAGQYKPPGILSQILCTAFPTLQGLTSLEKSWLGRIAAIVAAPAVFLLTISLPVVITSDEDEQDVPQVPVGRLVDVQGDESLRTLSGHGERTPLARYHDDEDAHTQSELEDEMEREGESDVSSIMSDMEKDFHGVTFNKWLTVTQCVVGPVFVAAVLFSQSRYAWKILLATAISGISVGVLVATFATTGRNMGGRVFRSLMGFVVAMVWIMAIADEVVRVLQTFGFIFGLSDAIVGLTIFAIGNSLADFVANLAVARFAPLMGLAACFGGPMLNMLMGVGISGSIVLRQSGQAYYPIEFSTTLLVSSLGLLFLLLMTAIFVPLNGYLLSKRWGIFLICSYVVIMTTNVIVEIKRERL